MNERPAELPELLEMWSEVDHIMDALEREEYARGEMDASVDLDKPSRRRTKNAPHHNWRT